MFRLAALLALLLAVPARAAETTVLPRGTFALDLAYLSSVIDKQWDGGRRARSLIDDMPRYEPGGGLQGILSARPRASFDFLLMQLLYGVTDDLTVGVYFPLVLRSVIQANFSWVPGDYQSGLGRSYSEQDFWDWAASMGQPRPEDTAIRNVGTPADIILLGRWRLPRNQVFDALRLQTAATLQVALPTGRVADPEELIDTGTTAWDLHSYGDVEVHLSADRPFLVDRYGVPKVNLGLDVFYSFLRPREYKAPRGERSPLLLNVAPYVGDTYWVDPGDWVGGTLSLDLALLDGPALATRVSGNDVEKAKALPPLLSVTLGYTYLATFQSQWTSQSPLWDYEREKNWQPGDKNIFRGMVTLSLLRVGLPVQLYASYRSQDIIPGRFTRPANVLTAGVKLVAKFW